jgi:hypothetical protein
MGQAYRIHDMNNRMRLVKPVRNFDCNAQLSNHKIMEMSGHEEVDASLLHGFEKKQKGHQSPVPCVHRRIHHFVRLWDWNVSSMSPLDS